MIWTCNKFCSTIHHISHCYRRKRSLGQGHVFTPVCECVDRLVSARLHAGIHTPPPRQTPTPWAEPPVPHTHEYYEIRSTSGRYASYWNAFLFIKLYYLWRQSRQDSLNTCDPWVGSLLRWFDTFDCDRVDFTAFRFSW